jgi:pimeloyl-ACP methyl ester carboxylesterase
LVALDLKGFGESDKPGDGAYGVDDQAELLCGFVRALSLDEFVLVGHSFGGAVCLRAVQFERGGAAMGVRGLVLVDSAAYPQEMPDFVRLFRLPVLGELALWLVPLAIGARLALRSACFDRATVSTEAVGAYARAAGLPGGRRALLATAREIVPRNLDAITRAYAEIDLPTLVLWGEHDTVVPLAVGKRLAEEMPNARLEVLAECGHVPHEERPEETARLIGSFLAGLGTG